MIRQSGLFITAAVSCIIGVALLQSGSSQTNPTSTPSAPQKPTWWVKLDAIPDRPATPNGYPDLAVDERNAYILKQGWLEARDLSTGRSIWRARGSRQVLTDGLRVFTFSSNRLLALDAKNGRTVWSVRYDHPYQGFSASPRDLCVCLFISKDLLLDYGIAIDIRTRTIRWKLNRENLWGSDGGLVGIAGAYAVWQVYGIGGAITRDAFRFFRLRDGHESTFAPVGEYAHSLKKLGINERGYFFELFVPFAEPLKPLPLELRAYNLLADKVSDVYGKFDVNPRPGCEWIIQVNEFAYQLIALTPEYVVLATEDSCGKYAALLPSSLAGSIRTVDLTLSVEVRQQLLGESRGVAVARTNKQLIQLAARPTEVLALLDNPLRLESLKPEDGEYGPLAPSNTQPHAHRVRT
jgi:hypothetical protein